MKKLFVMLAAASVWSTAAADEGMWMLPYLQKMNIEQMKERGCKLSAEEIYSVDGSSLKDAIVIFGAGCTGEIVSPDGLLFTNHHCGYGSIQELSSVEHDYLKNGFWARNRTEEIPAPGLKVRFVRKIADVTPKIVGNVPSIAGQEEYAKITGENAKALVESLQQENPGMEVIVRSFFGGNQYFAFVLEVFSDVRLVGTPPSSIGKFGGDTDNWMWPRHTGDFSIFRVYAGTDNKPAEYSPENRPYKAEKYLRISLDGVEENDFAMIMGFPGSTQRYATSYEIDRMLAIDNPQRIFIRGERQAILWKDMMESDAVRIQYASKYAMSSNYWKNSIGMSRGIEKLGVKAKKQAQEEAFQRWAEANTLPEEGYVDALPTIARVMEESAPVFASVQYIREALLGGVEILRVVPYLNGKIASDDSEKGKQWKEEWKEKQGKILADFYKDYNPATDRRVAYRMLEIVRENCKELPSFYADEIDAKFGGDIRAYVDNVYDQSRLTSLEGALTYLGQETQETEEAYHADPAYVLSKSVGAKYKELQEQLQRISAPYAAAHRRYIAGLMLQQPAKAWASDANFTLRLTYGRVLPYDPADGIRYNYYTTLKGVMEKEDPANPAEFTVPEKLKELYAARDFGRYANEKGELPTCFLADCDITGGNSGSPVLNARGELIGLAFDGNWEAMSGDVAFEPELQRTIAVDVRYVLFVIDKFADAGWLLEEMDIR